MNMAGKSFSPISTPSFYLRGGFASAWYWSSSENNNNNAWNQNFEDGNQNNNNKNNKNNNNYVRAARVFGPACGSFRAWP